MYLEVNLKVVEHLMRFIKYN